MSTPFQTTYSTLNPRQKQAVDTIYGPVLVIAGPGSGKTQILSARIANILMQTDVNPSNILCLTFTDNAAKNMRERLSRVIGADAYKVAIHTFHSFGNEILNRYRSRISDYAEATPIDDIEASRLFDAILTALPWNDPYKPGQNANEKIRELRNAIKLVKDAGITPTEYTEIIETNLESSMEDAGEEWVAAIIEEMLKLGFNAVANFLRQSFSGSRKDYFSTNAFYADKNSDMWVVSDQVDDWAEIYHNDQFLGKVWPGQELRQVIVDFKPGVNFLVAKVDNNSMPPGWMTLRSNFAQGGRWLPGSGYFVKQNGELLGGRTWYIITRYIAH